MADPTNSIVEDLGRRESLMTAFVCHDPESGAEKTLHKGVQSPQSRAEVHIGHGFWSHIIVEDIEGCAKQEEISGDIRQACDRGAFIAVSRNRIANLLDCVVGDLELVAISVDQFCVLGFLLLRGQRRQGCARGRLTRAVKR